MLRSNFFRSIFSRSISFFIHMLNADVMSIREIVWGVCELERYSHSTLLGVSECHAIVPLERHQPC